MINKANPRVYGCGSKPCTLVNIKTVANGCSSTEWSHGLCPMAISCLAVQFEPDFPSHGWPTGHEGQHMASSVQTTCVQGRASSRWRSHVRANWRKERSVQRRRAGRRRCNITSRYDKQLSLNLANSHTVQREDALQREREREKERRYVVTFAFRRFDHLRRRFSASNARCCGMFFLT